VQKWEYSELCVAFETWIDDQGNSGTSSHYAAENRFRSITSPTERLMFPGEDGWELVSVSQDGASRIFTFKRPKE
jgi:hypothetical protein